MTTDRVAQSCVDCIGKHADYRSEFGHLEYEPETGATILVQHTRRYVIKCDDCKQTIGQTDNLSESAAGGRCEECRSPQPLTSPHYL